MKLKFGKFQKANAIPMDLSIPSMLFMVEVFYWVMTIIIQKGTIVISVIRKKGMILNHSHSLEMISKLIWRLN